MDYLGRKTVVDSGKVVTALVAEMQKTFDIAKEIEVLKPLAEKTQSTVKRLGDAAMHLGKAMMEGQIMNALAFSYSFMDVSGDVVMAWMLLWRANIAGQQLGNGAKKKDQKFLEAQLKTAEFSLTIFCRLQTLKSIPFWGTVARPWRSTMRVSVQNSLI